MRFTDKVAVVTGSSRGIGRAIALAFAREGASVVVDYRSHPEEARSVVEEIEGFGAKATAVRADVSEPESIRDLVGEAVRLFGRLDVMVNNAGMERKMPFLETPLQVWNEVLAVNLTGTWIGCQEAAKRMVSQGDGGCIVNVSSVHENRPMPTNAPYCAAKGGVRMLMRTLAVELAPHGITVNDVAPGAVETPINANLDEHPEQMQELLTQIPLGRIGQPEEVAALVLYLASEEASYVTGSTFTIDGGMTRQAGSL